jgi:hypothetical protein
VSSVADYRCIMHSAMTEQWQSMPNYERYLVSDQGRVMNSKSGTY